MNLWKDLNPSEKSQVILTTLLALVFLVLILIAFLVSRGNDIEYFKSRIDLMDQRTLYIEQKIDKMNEKLGDYRRDLNEIRTREMENEKKIDEHSRWIEHWKSLPSLPKPPKR